MPKSEAFTLELSARMAVLRKLHCMESGDDLGPVCVGFGRADWVGVDGRLTGPFFFIAVIGSSKDVKKKFSTVRIAVSLDILQPPPRKTKLEHK
jgi:hypothetical protein